MEIATYFLDGTSYSKTYWQPYLTDTSGWLDRQPQFSTSTASMVAGADGMASVVSNGSFKYSYFAQFLTLTNNLWS